MARREPGTFIFDADCGVCTRVSVYFTSHWKNDANQVVSFQSLGRDGCERVGVDFDDAHKAAFWVAPGAQPARGHAAVSAALIQCGGWQSVVGRFITLPVVSLGSRVVYALFARYRHQMPGKTLACEIPQPREAPTP